MTKILIPVEDRTFANAQLEFLSKHELPADTCFTIMNVIKPIAVQDYGFAVPATYLEAMAKEDERSARKLLSEVEEKLRKLFPEAKIERLIEFGGAAAEIIRIAKECGQDWIVIGSHGRTGLDKFFLGSVSQSVVNHAHCSVTVVRLPQESTKDKEIKKELAGLK